MADAARDYSELSGSGCATVGDDEVGGVLGDVVAAPAGSEKSVPERLIQDLSLPWDFSGTVLSMKAKTGGCPVDGDDPDDRSASL